MHAFQELSEKFDAQFNKRHFPHSPKNLYDASQYILQIGGKRVRPVTVLMGNELFSDLIPDAYSVANAIELFHNFSLIHDDIMDKAPLRRGVPTVHMSFGESTALLAGDVMLVAAYEYLNSIDPIYLRPIISLFNRTAKEVCEGQQLDMDFEKRDTVRMEEYVEMITLKTSVLLAASIQMGAILGGAGGGNQQHLYAFGKNLGIAFQVQDDYLDCYGDPEKFGKQVGGDILANKKTFLFIHAMESATEAQKNEMQELLKISGSAKVQRTLALYDACGCAAWAKDLKETYFKKAMESLEEVAVLSSRKTELEKLARFLMQRDS